MAKPLGSYVFEEFVFQFRNDITHLPDRQLYFMLSIKIITYLLKGITVNKPFLKDNAVTFRMYPFINRIIYLRAAYILVVMYQRLLRLVPLLPLRRVLDLVLL